MVACLCVVMKGRRQMLPTWYSLQSAPAHRQHFRLHELWLYLPRITSAVKSIFLHLHFLFDSRLGNCMYGVAQICSFLFAYCLRSVPRNERLSEIQQIFPKRIAENLGLLQIGSAVGYKEIGLSILFNRFGMESFLRWCCCQKYRRC